MDRRRYIPSSEGLEGRALLTSLFGSSTKSNSAATDVPATFRQKELRIEHLPFYLNKLEQGRFLSSDNMTSLKNDLLAVAGKLHAPSSVSKIAFNTHLRAEQPHRSLSVEDAKLLNHTFGNIVSSAGATPEQTQNLLDDMNALAKIDAKSRQPAFLAQNDYALVAQTFVAIARPILTPAFPELAKGDGIRPQVGYNKTVDPQPRFVGSYGVGATVSETAGDINGGFNSSGVTMRLLDDATGKVLGSSPIIKEGSNPGGYIIKVASPLAPGTYTLRVQAVDATGHESDPSERFFLKVVERPHQLVTAGVATPQGPVGTR